MEKNKNIKKYKLSRENLIFYQSYEFYKKFTENNNELVFYSNNGFNFFFKEFLYQIDLITYSSIYIEIDPIFYKLDEILKRIKKTTSKKANICLVTTHIPNFHKRESCVSLKNVVPLVWTEENIIDIEGNNYLVNQ